MLASTTGNITGVYDMSGGSWEYVMGLVSSNAINDSIGIGNSSWIKNRKYVNTYAYDSSNYRNQTAYNRGRLGDATAEVVISTSGFGGWYTDFSFFPNTNGIFSRGGDYLGNLNCEGTSYVEMSGPGLFSFAPAQGQGSSRLVLSFIS